MSATACLQEFGNNPADSRSLLDDYCSLAYQDGDVGAGVFLEVQKILISGEAADAGGVHRKPCETALASRK